MVNGLCKGLIGTMREQSYTVQGKMVLLKYGSIMFQFLVEDFSVGIRTYDAVITNSVHITSGNLISGLVCQNVRAISTVVRFPHSVFTFCDFMSYTLFISTTPPLPNYQIHLHHLLEVL